MRSRGRIVGLGSAATGLLLAVACSSFGRVDSPTVDDIVVRRVE